MNLKKTVIFCFIVLVGIIFINNLFPKAEESCRCTVQSEAIQVLCYDVCKSYECMTGIPGSGYCRDGKCVTIFKIWCLYEDSKSKWFAWFEPCWDCAET